ncbi:MAG: hypothetical protein HZC10_01235 [Nitrospirae bacterium]|nr:hypothetical protein [Nitrospirota bacterium]
MLRLLSKSRLLFFLIVIIFYESIDARELTAKNDEEKPIVITSQRMIALNEQNKLIFEKDVVAKKDDMTLYADKMEILFIKTNDSSLTDAAGSSEDKRDISTIKAMGNVKVVKGEKTATADEAVYYKDEEKVVLTGSPKAWEKDDMVTGTKMTIYIKEDKSIVEGSKVVVNPQKKDKKKGVSIFK